MFGGVRDGGSRAGARCVLTNGRVSRDEVGMAEIATVPNGTVDCFHGKGQARSMRRTCTIYGKWNPQGLKAKGEDKHSNAMQNQHGTFNIERLLSRSTACRPLHRPRCKDDCRIAHMHLVGAPLAPTLARPSVDDVQHATPHTPRPLPRGTFPYRIRTATCRVGGALGRV